MAQSNIKLYGADWCSDCKRSKRFLGEQRIQYEYINIEENTEVVAFKGENHHLKTVITKNTQTGATEELHPAGVFVFIGLAPNSKHFQDAVKLDAQGFILTGIDFLTSTPGIFAAGDVRAGSVKQLVSAAGEGAAAAISIREHLRGHDAHTMEKALVTS
jgi:thioredoxin reductase (NADPH)